jgi:tripartite-type tricarboxylate transporter receptor subunit TctC
MATVSVNWTGPVAAAMVAVGLALPARADAISDFYRGRTINIYIGYSAGGGYDFYGRLVARHLGRHVPGQPAVVPQNMPGAGSIRAANYVYSVAAKDGTALGIVTQTIALEEALGTPGVQYKAAEFNWIGRTTSNVDVMLMWHTSKVKTFEDAYKYEVPVAGTGPGSASEVMPQLLDGLLGTKFKIIGGYPGATEGMIAMERGEVEGSHTSWNTVKLSKQDWLRDHKISILVQYAQERHPDLPGVPTMVEVGRTPEERQVLALYASGAVVGRAFFAPPRTPKQRVAALRTAFDAMLKDEQFLGEIKKTNAEFDPMSGTEMQAVIERAAAIPEAVRQRARAARGMK